MPRLSLADQRKVIRAMPIAKQRVLRKVCIDCQMKGRGITDVVKALRRKLGSLNEILGAKILKELIRRVTGK